MKLIAKAAKEVSVEIKQDQEAILKALGKSLKVIEKLYFHHWKIVTSIHYCSINTISISNPKNQGPKTAKSTKQNRTSKLFGPTKIYIAKSKFPYFQSPFYLRLCVKQKF